MEKPVENSNSVSSGRTSRFGSTLTMKGKVVTTDESKLVDKQKLDLALMSALLKSSDTV